MNENTPPVTAAELDGEAVASAEDAAPIALPEPDAYNTFIAGLEVEAIELVRLTAERTAPGHAVETRFELGAGYRFDESSAQWRYDITAIPTDDTGSELGRLEASIVVAGHTANPPQQDCVAHFGQSSGALMAHPYLREAVASTGLRLNFGGLLLPMIKVQPPGPVEHDEREG